SCCPARCDMGPTESRRARRRWSHALTHTAQTAQLAHHFRPRVEALEDRVQLGDTLLGLSVVTLGGLGFASWDTALALAPCASEGEWQDGPFSLWEAADPVASMALTKRSPSDEAGSATITGRTPSNLMTQIAGADRQS